ncbi:MAG TPA: glycosyltransferase family 39 protein [Acidimicrobiia bacterium]|nr:glycosyltransferase family 39 protein [Acidimicrobiia bacterium]
MLSALAVAALALRVLYIVRTQGDVVSGDGTYYHALAAFLADGRGFIAPELYEATGRMMPNASHPPVWPVVLAGPAALGLRTFFEQQLFTALIGSAVVVAVGVAGRLVAGAGAGLIAAALAAIYPNLWLYEREVLSEPLAMLLAACTIILAYRFIERPGIGRAGALGALCAVLAQTRSEQMLLFPFLVMPLVLRTHTVPLPRRLLWLGASAAIALVLLAPWSAYNANRFERPVFLSTQFGAGFLTSNCDETYHGERLGSVHPQCSAQNRRDVDLSGDPTEDDAQMRDEGLRYVRAHLSRVPVVVLAREGRVWNVYRPSQQMEIDSSRDTNKSVIRLGYVAYWALLPFAVAGVLLLHRRRVALLPLLVFPAITAIAVAVQFGYTRYRAPAEVSILILSAVTLDAIVRRVRRPPPPSRVVTLPAEEPSEILSVHGFDPQDHLR